MNVHDTVCSPPAGTSRVPTGTFRLYCVLLSLVLGSLSGRASPPPAGVAPVISPAGGFSIEGDLLANTPSANFGDWVATTNFSGGGAGVLTPAGVPINPATTFHFTDPFNGKDSIFSGGLKWTDNPNLWTWTTSKPSSKTDINNVLLHIATDADGHIWVIVAADRFSTSGESYIDFEFLQNTLSRSNNGTFVSSGPQGGRTTNDMLLSLAFVGGGSQADFFAWRWQGNGNGGYAYADVTAALPAGRVFVALNTNTVAVPYGAFGGTTYAPNAFAEAAIDLTALLGNFDQCLSFGFKTIMVKTKSSSSSTAGIEDFIDPIQYKLKIGPSADAGPDQTRCVEGPQTVFPLNGIATAGLQPIVSTTWSVVSGNATIDSPTSLITTAIVSSVSATLRLTVLQTNGCIETDDVVLNVAPLPACSITGPALVCPRATNLFQGPLGMNAYSWSVTGNATLAGATNARTVSVVSGGSCGESYALSLLVISNNCSSSCSTEVLVNDTTSPTISCPADRVLECPADTRTNVTGVATAQDDCGKVTVTYSDVVTNLCAGTKIIWRTWTATDLCGNATDCLQTITVRDTIKPTILCPTNKVLECPADTSTNANGVATAQDGCGAVVISYSDSVSNNCGGAKVISRTWTAIDACGNSASCVQTITVRDTLRPSLVCPPSVILECPADTTTNNTGVAISQDACGSVTVAYIDTVTNNCSGTKVISRRWIATDECGNTTNCVQTITVRDTIKPTLTCPPDLILECPADTSTNATGVAIADDGCSAVTLRYTDSVTNSCGGTKVIARTWTATDACGNSISCVQKITVRDTTSPTLTCPQDLVLECPAVTTTNATGVATATDGCGSVTIRFSDSVTTNCPGTKVIARTWTATDSCSNVSSCVQTITVRDTIKPTLICPTNVVLECPADTRTNVTGVAMTSDGCSAVTLTYSDSVQTNCGGSKVISRTWTAADQCGNSTNCVQTITVRDTIKPTITCPANRVLDCPADTRTNATGVATAQDGCSQITISYSDSITNNCGGTEVIARTWTATDACGNSASCVQTITVRDVTPPTISCPSNVVLECPADTTTNATGVATAQDTCGQVTIRYNDSVTNNCGGTKVISRVWTATDECGNASSCVQTITVRDTIRPTLTLPANLTLECPAVTTTNNTGVATAQDGCGSVTVTFTDVVSNYCGGTKVILRNWRAIDSCGNSTNAIQTITVRDLTPPTLTLPTNVVLECPTTNTSTNYTGVPTSVDGCGSVTVTYNDVVTTNCGNTKVIARTWTATDQCGNATNGVQTITIRDTIKPSLVVPGNLTLECPANTTTNNTGSATALDGCGAVTLVYADSVSNSCGGTKVISRLWTATDACGNTTNKVQLITLVDTHPPTITAPPSVLLDCPASTATNNTGTAVAQDGCSGLTIGYSDIVSNGCGGTKVITRTWTATDACGNAASALQTITLRDITAPALKLPANVVQQCPGDTRTNVAGTATATDGCGSVAISYSDVVSNGCSFTRTVWRLWTATDQCGNTTNGLQTISVIDTTKPTIICPNISVQCVGDIPPAYTNLAAFRAAGGTATDTCSAGLTFSLISDSGLIGRCPGTVTRVYRVTDDCGNFADGTHRITVDDTIAPDITCPISLTVECGLSLDPTNTGRATATDNCATNVAITYSDAPVSSVYDINFYAADPDFGTGPYSPTYTKLGPADLPCPTAAMLSGRAQDPLRNAVAFGPTSSQLDALTSLGGVGMALGQVVPFEAVIGLSGAPGPERGTIEFSASWATHTTSNDRFGFDTNYMVYCAFVDTGDPGFIDPNNNARVVSVSSTLINQGTIDEQIVGTFQVTGLDVGDQIPVEIWMVLDSTQPGNVGGTIAAQLVSAAKFLNPPEPITVGSKTISIGNLNKMNPLPPPHEQPPLGPPTPQPPIPPGVIVSVIDRSWVATDDCGNSRTCTQRITIRDASPPVLVCPPDITLDCPDMPLTNITGVATATDCSPVVSITYTDSISNTCGGSKLISRTWTALDIYSNAASCVQLITVRDTTPPVMVCPPNLTLDCPNAPVTNLTGVATATDTCSPVISITYSDSISNNCGGSKLISRTWTALDACGNAASCVQLITVRDLTPPAITCPAGMVLDCPADLSPNNTGTATAVDACGSVTVAYSDAVSNLCGGTKVITRTWTATDECGNAASCAQTITVRDITPPTLTCQPDRTILAGVAWNFDNPSASDLCSAVTVQVMNTTTNRTATNTLVAIRTWVATDSCGNSSTCRQTIIVLLGDAPVIISQPQGASASYGGSATMTVGATGTGPLTYQWMFNGTNLDGATGTSLTLDALEFADAGLYCVVVSNAAGTVTSSMAVLNVAAKLLIEFNGTIEKITWPAPFILQWSTDVAGPYTDVPGATSPFYYDTAQGPVRFFRLRLPSFSLSVSNAPGGPLVITCPGIEGCNFIIQASTNLETWVDLGTNASPFTYIDTDIGIFPHRFYRAKLAH